MKKPKIVLIGAGSHSFGLMTLKDLMDTPSLHGSEVVLVDIAADKLERMTRLAHRMNEIWQAGLKLSATNDRREALPGADMVITSVERKHYELWQQDITIPEKHGCHRLYGENGGPGGLFHTLRQVPLLLDIARDVERLCPEAWLLNLSNPESRLCLALNRYTRVKNVGICLGAYITQNNLAGVLGLKQHEVDIKVAGINHCHWVVDVRRVGTGEDLYPALRQRIEQVDPAWEPLSRECLRRFGLYPGPADTHVGEYLGWGWKYLKPAQTAWIFKGDEAEKEREAIVEKLARGQGPIQGDEEAAFKSLLIEGGLRWQTIDILLSLLDNGNRYILSLNQANHGYISNLRQDAVVEIPAIVGANRIYGLHVGELPTAIAGILEHQLYIMELVVEAAVKGDRQAALEALIIDPNVPDPDAAQKILDEMLILQKDYLPQFA
jgi:alpha-galactosidase|uniref:Alpha-glucosidase/alpha-galactosidase n=1 Tax=Anaerolinea thermolimosa TaxID=229919 RepID=A0A7C4PJT1_9CHLR